MPQGEMRAAPAHRNALISGIKAGRPAVTDK